ncbi:tetratricopeptide repeat protein [Saccharospirillum mangrovi]|uniref:tetratricopeptide repeat protein n=1 Tax=Saccharospirillum mangrovi TaxID=2161747 RepID=UPI000D3C7ACF|nr:hypothetical protein [Saccharospirillum mangrovi]
MSRIHQALTRPLPAPRAASGFNPLSDTKRAHGQYWWLVAVVALALAVILLWAPWQHRVTPEPPLTPPPDTAVLPVLPALPESLSSLVPELQASLQTLQAEPSDTLALLPSRRAIPATVMMPEQPPVPTATEPKPTPVKTTVSQPPPPAETAPETPIEPPIAPPQPTLNSEPNTTVTRIEDRWQDQVQAALADNQLALAEQSLRAWIAEAPEAAQPRVWLAKLLLSQDRLDAIGALLEGQNSVEAQGLLALWHEKAGRPEQAAVLFEQLTRAQPTHGAWQLHWAINAENSGQVAQAVRLYHNYLNRFAADNPRLTAFANNRVRSLETP